MRDIFMQRLYVNLIGEVFDVMRNTSKRRYAERLIKWVDVLAEHPVGRSHWLCRLVNNLSMYHRPVQFSSAFLHDMDKSEQFMALVGERRGG